MGNICIDFLHKGCRYEDAKTSLAYAVALVSLGASGSLWAQEEASLSKQVVSATGFRQQALLAPAAITVLEREQLERKPVSDLAEVFRDIPGIDVVDSGVPGMNAPVVAR